MIEIKDLYVNVGDKEILKGINLKINKGEIHVIMGPNGSRKNHNSKCNTKQPRIHKEKRKHHV